ncbi:hypothetical protein [Bradyrhizobium japonicum]|jgi:hypothetical protein|uniref:hypothetical protein n=1 Tax=Bradyrhizobium japonicum TaxID=375 RepID=UPI0020A01229|nr:hypothetical protein [Bradyrhizobium japonicum]MCP1765527.1 hypothetical protein [Bradyrhizobium japonicum]MCP1787664.1 hypothetical protein [Bradyrhizobium japonicum]MCP1809540.1 hypothetical protein [Bradyrhizobium japonicum]MCP1818474.1 hypothetical protein [Bradyrhizobium japonicum]MCP1870016.1 hypothetical protein [Bradyrhizobium japonicum]
MTARDDNQHQKTWHVYYNDVHVGTIGKRARVPTSGDRWGWSVGFYPRTEPGTHQIGSAESFEAARLHSSRWLGHV